jgi:asparagine synthetase B (glutamine-hydrolysing)
MLIHIQKGANGWKVSLSTECNDHVYEEDGLLLVANLTYGVNHEKELHADLRTALAAYRRGDVKHPLFNGYYFLVIIDKARQRLVLMKDPVGIRTGYYTRRGRDLYVGTNSHAVARTSGLVAFDPVAVFLKLSSMRVFEGHSYYRDVHELLMGQQLTFGPQLQLLQDVVDPLSLPSSEQDITLEESAHILRELTLKAHEKLMGPQNVILLSGGIDSCVMLACLHILGGNQRLHNLTYRVKGTGFDETPFAVEAGKRLGAITDVVTMDPEDEAIFEDFDKKILQTNSPAISQWLFLGRLDTTGTDYFAGQDTRLHTPPNDPPSRLLLTLLQRRVVGSPLEALLARLATPPIDLLRQLQQRFGENRRLYLLERLLSLANAQLYLLKYVYNFNPTRCQIPVPKHVASEVNSLFATDWRRIDPNPRAIFNAMIDREWRGQFVDDIRYMQGLGHLHGMTTQMPFYDEELVRFSASIPFRHAFLRAEGTDAFSYGRAKVGKVVLREAFRKEISEKVLYRKKAVMPANLLFMQGALGRYVRRFLRDDLSSSSSFLREFGLNEFARGFLARQRFQITDQTYLATAYYMSIFCRYRALLT